MRRDGQGKGFRAGENVASSPGTLYPGKTGPYPCGEDGLPGGLVRGGAPVCVCTISHGEVGVALQSPPTRNHCTLSPDQHN